LISGILLHYITIAIWFNETYIFTYNDQIIIRKKPIPWVGDTVFSFVKLKDLYSINLRSSPSLRLSFVVLIELPLCFFEVGSNQESTDIFEVRAKDDNGTDKKIIFGTYEETLFIEKTLRDYFNLEDEPQEGQSDS